MRWYTQKKYQLGQKPASKRHHSVSLIFAAFILFGLVIFSQTVWGAHSLLSPGVMHFLNGQTSSTNTVVPVNVPAEQPGASGSGKKSSPKQPPIVSVPLLAQIKDPSHSY